MLISHFLIGPPSSGKSTFANQLIKLQPTAKIISTDAIRALLFGDESIQGDWSLIEEKVLSQMRESFKAGQPVIYDATNAKREWRISLLSQVASDNVHWMGWHLQTPLKLCKTWNKQRRRQVPETVIDEFFQALQDKPPRIEEGFVDIKSLPLTEKGLDLVQVEYLLKKMLAKSKDLLQK